MRPNILSMTAWLFVLVSATPAFAKDLIGTKWVTANGSGIIRLEPCGPKLCGKIAGPGPKADKNGAQTDVKNPNPALRSRPIVGLAILTGFSDQGKGKLTGGQIYDPTEGKSYRSELRLKPDGKLEVKGCIGPICVSQIWTPLS